MADSFKPIQIGGEFIDLDALQNGEYVNIEYTHEKIHDGEMWGCSHYGGTIAAGGTFQVTFLPGTITPHVVWEVSAGAACQVTIIRNGALTGGTLLPVHNRMVAESGSSLMSAKQGGTIAGGTSLLNGYLPGGVSRGVSSAAGASSRGASEWILPSGGTITLQLIGVGDSTGASINCEFYEENET